MITSQLTVASYRPLQITFHKTHCTKLDVFLHIFPKARAVRVHPRHDDKCHLASPIHALLFSPAHIHPSLSKLLSVTMCLCLCLYFGFLCFISCTQCQPKMILCGQQPLTGAPGSDRERESWDGRMDPIESDGCR